jgi:hypothetical protein
MQRHAVRTPAEALVYITDCNLATVCDMATKKRRPKLEFERQILIAQRAINWMQDMGVDFSTTRAKDVVACGGVKEWARMFMPTP